jgi:hypothetical protein
LLFVGAGILAVLALAVVFILPERFADRERQRKASEGSVSKINIAKKFIVGSQVGGARSTSK